MYRSKFKFVGETNEKKGVGTSCALLCVCIFFVFMFEF
jgi:hypothetical protein